jgi:predicted nucleic acid-binding protein
MADARVLHSLDFVQLEVLSALRRRVARGLLTEPRADAAVFDLGSLPLRRHHAFPLTRRVWQLRAALSPYDAAYVALAEALSAPLLTTDKRLASSSGHRARIVAAGSGA